MPARKLLVPTLLALVKVLAAMVARGEEPTARQWQEFVSQEGNFRVLLPDKPTSFKTNEPLESYGKAERYICVAKAQRGHALASFLATSVKESQEYFARFTPEERIAKLRDETIAESRKNFPGADIEVDREARSVGVHRASYWRVTIKSPEKWLQVQTLACYVDGTFYAAEVLHFSKGSARAVTQVEVEKFFDSYELVSVRKLVRK